MGCQNGFDNHCLGLALTNRVIYPNSSCLDCTSHLQRSSATGCSPADLHGSSRGIRPVHVKETLPVQVSLSFFLTGTPFWTVYGETETQQISSQLAATRRPLARGLDRWRNVPREARASEGGLTWPWAFQNPNRLAPNIRFNPLKQRLERVVNSPTNQNGTIGFDPQPTIP